MRADPALLGIVVAKKKPPMGEPPPFGGSDKPGPAKPGVSVAISAGKPAKPPMGGAEETGETKPDDEGHESTAHSNLDEIMSGDPRVASAVAGLLAALCSEERAEGEYPAHGGGDMTGTEGM